MSSREKRLRRAQQLAIDGILHAPDSFKKALYGELRLICNGCGSAKAKIDIIPDKILGTDISYCCYIHDFEYEKGTTEEHKVIADNNFKKNLFIIIKGQKWHKRQLMRVIAYGYYLGVKFGGKKAYWKGKR